MAVAEDANSTHVARTGWDGEDAARACGDRCEALVGAPVATTIGAAAACGVAAAARFVPSAGTPLAAAGPALCFGGVRGARPTCVRNAALAPIASAALATAARAEPAAEAEGDVEAAAVA